VNREECSERIRLTDEYSRLVTELNSLLDSLRAPSKARTEEIWSAAEVAKSSSQKAWEALEEHINDHRCTDLPLARPDPLNVSGFSHILAMAAVAAVDLILVANDNRQYVDVNEAAALVMGMPRSEIVGRRVDDFFVEVQGKAGFIADGIQRGICELNTGGKRRRFEYLAKANFAPGLHLSVLREMKEDES
jgi:PAS domain-containing protein